MVLGITLAILLFMELFSAAFFTLRDSPGQREAASSTRFWPEFRRSCTPLRDQPWGETYGHEWDASYVTHWEPYVYWRRDPYQGETVNIDERGLRDTDNPVSWAEADFKVLMFGGSTLWGTGARDEGTIASWVSRLLNDKGQGRVHVENWGESGYVSTQELIQLYLLLREGVRPDLVVFYDGFNDLHAAREDRQAGVPMNEVHRRQEFALGRELDQPDRHRKAFLKDLLGRSSLVRGLAAIQARVTPRPEEEEEPPIDQPALAREVVADYLVNVRQVRELAHTYGFQAVCFWQPMLASKAPEALSEEEQAAVEAWGEPNLSFEREVCQRFAAVADTSGVVDLQDLFDSVKETVFLDYVHIGENGNQRVAQAMVEVITGTRGTAPPHLSGN